MTEAQHTPGPWTYAHSPTINGVSGLFEIHWSPEGECVAEIVHDEANARLIAAAPDLLAELRSLLTAVTYVTPPRDFGTITDPNHCFEARVPVEFVEKARAATARATEG